MISAMAGTSASAVAAPLSASGVSSFTGRSARSRCRETCPTSDACTQVFIILVLSSPGPPPPPPRALLFPRDLFWSTGKHLRQLRGGGPPPGLRSSYEAGAHLPRFSLACQLRVPLSASPTPLSPPLRLPPLREPLSLSFRPPPPCLRPRGFSLTFSRYRPPARSRFYLPLRPFPPLPPGFDLLLLPSCQLLTFLRAFLAHSTFPTQLLSFRTY